MPSPPPKGRSRLKDYGKVAAALVLVAALIAGYVLLADNPAVRDALDPDRIRTAVAGLGPWGPVALIAFMALAIVFSPIPSAPITLAAGALYGHLWGTVYALIGAEIGALIAFWIARTLGRPFVARMLAQRFPDGPAHDGRSEWMVAGGILVARLFPFISFDAVSYLAGLAPIRTWLFAAVTFIGMVPATFLFSHLGGTMTADDEPMRLLNLLALLGIAALAWVGWRMRKRRGSGRQT